MRLVFVPMIMLCAMATVAFAADKPNDVARGKQLYTATGCDQCHGTHGQGGAGPRLAPGALSY